MANSLLNTAQQLKGMIEHAKLQAEAAKDAAITQVKLQAEAEKKEVSREHCLYFCRPLLPDKQFSSLFVCVVQINIVTTYCWLFWCRVSGPPLLLNNLHTYSIRNHLHVIHF